MNILRNRACAKCGETVNTTGYNGVTWLIEGNETHIGDILYKHPILNNITAMCV
jgi:hypothetical protein